METSDCNITRFTCTTHRDVDAAVTKLTGTSTTSMAPTMVAIDFEWSMDGRSNGKVEVIHIGKETSQGNYECFVFVLNQEMVSKGSPLQKLFRNNNIIKVGYGGTTDLPYCIATMDVFPTPYIDIQSVNALMTGEPFLNLAKAAHKMFDFILPAKPYLIFDKGAKDAYANGMALDNYSIYKIAEKLLHRTSPVVPPTVPRVTTKAYRLTKSVDGGPSNIVQPSESEMSDAAIWLLEYLRSSNPAKNRYRIVNYMSNAYGKWVKKYPNVDTRRNIINTLIDAHFSDMINE